MPKVTRIPITNVLLGGDYTGRICVGPNQQPMNVLLDTGSSALAVDGKKYKLNIAGGDQSTHLAQHGTYNDGNSWTGAVIQTKVSIGEGAASIGLANCNVAVAYTSSPNMFKKADGILGLAYAKLDDAFTMPDDTSKHQYTRLQVLNSKGSKLTPYLTQLSTDDVTSDRIAFLTHRSFTHVGGGKNDPLNQGVMVVGGGEESTDLYTGSFQTVKVLSEEWYNTNLKEVIVGSADPIAVPSDAPKSMPSNSYVDSGAQTLSLDPEVLDAFISKFSAAQQAQLKTSIDDNKLVSVADLDLVSWPVVTFVLQGDPGNVSLTVAPTDYWQVNVQKVGMAFASISRNQAQFSSLGLPLLNGYFTIFDGEADEGTGVIKFAAKK